MAIFDGTLEARARRDLPLGAEGWDIVDAMYVAGDLVEIKMDPAWYTGPDLDLHDREILSWLRGRFTGLHHHPIAFKLLKEAAAGEKKWSGVELTHTLRRCWKAKQVRYLVEGLYNKGLSPEVVEGYRDSLFETQEIYDLCLRMAGPGRRGCFHGIHYLLSAGPYILTPEQENGNR